MSRFWDAAITTPIKINLEGQTANQHMDFLGEIDILRIRENDGRKMAYISGHLNYDAENAH